MSQAFLWLAIIEFIGLVFVPINVIIFSHSEDKGFSFAKVFGVLVLVYIVWIFGLFKFIPVSWVSILVFLLLLSVISLFLFIRNKEHIMRFLKNHWRFIIISEAVFLIHYFFALSFLYHSPSIKHTEQLMDFAFLNSIVNSNYFPPDDPWLSGYSINYYYFGHMIYGVLSKLARIDTFISYNLSLALGFSFIAQSIFGLVYILSKRFIKSMSKRVILGGLGILFLVYFSNLEPILELISSLKIGAQWFWNFWDVKGLNVSDSFSGIYPNSGWWDWGWRATRIIDTVISGRSFDYTITEFPFFSFILGDLHAHFMSIPFVLLFIYCLSDFWNRNNAYSNQLLPLIRICIVLGLVWGAILFINSTDIFFITVLLFSILVLKGYQQFSFQSMSKILMYTMQVMFIVIIFGVLLFFPFLRDFFSEGSQFNGIWPVRKITTQWQHWILIWGFSLLVVVAFFSYFYKKILKGLEKKTVIFITGFLFAAFFLWALLELVLSILEMTVFSGILRIFLRFISISPWLLVSFFSFLLAFQFAKNRQSFFPIVFIFIALASFVIMIPELFRIGDMFGNRMNTIFKFYYQAWILFSIAMPFLIYKVFVFVKTETSTIKKVLSYSLKASILVLMIGSLYYVPGALIAKANTDDFRGFNGLSYIPQDEFNAIHWLSRQEKKGNIVEAIGPDYSYYGRVSASTGIPTIIGWVGHQSQWRGTRAEFNVRQEDVKKIYLNINNQETRNLLKKYKVKWIIAGNREKKLFGSELSEKLSLSFNKVYSSKGIDIFEIE